jgi:hypothetical protein
VKVQVVELEVGFEEVLHALDHQIGRDVVRFQEADGVEFENAGFVEVALDVLVSGGRLS